MAPRRRSGTKKGGACRASEAGDFDRKGKQEAMAPRRRSGTKKMASASEAGDLDRKGKQAVDLANEAMGKQAGDFEILRLNKEMREAIKNRPPRQLEPRVRPSLEKAQKAGAKKMKVVKQRLPLEEINLMKESLYTIEDIPEDKLLTCYSEECRNVYSSHKVIEGKIRAWQLALLAQYDALGYAEDEFEVTDDEDEDTNTNKTDDKNDDKTDNKNKVTDTDDKNKVEAAN